MNVKRIGRAVLAARLDANLSQEDLARRADMASSYISKLERGLIARPGADALRRVAAALAIPLAELIGDEAAEGYVQPPTPRGRPADAPPPATDQAAPTPDPFNTGARLLPVYRWGSCGDPRDTESGPQPYTEIYPPVGHELQIGPRGIVIWVKGDSMSRQGIRDGDYVYVNPDRAPRVGGAVLANCRGKDGTDYGMVIKLLTEDQIGMQGRGLVLRSDGDEGPEAVPCDEFTIIGPVVLVMSLRPPGPQS